jgi:signal transduction histidine kinase
MGLAALVGWHAGIAWLIHVRPGLSLMPYNSALAFLLCGAALAGLVLGRRRVAMIGGSLAALLGLLTLVQWIFGVPLGIDQLFMRQVDPLTPFPGRIPLDAAFCFLLAGGTIVSLGARPLRHQAPPVAAVSGSVVLALGATALAGYLVGLPTYAWWPVTTRMSTHGTVGCAVLGLGLVSWAWQQQRSAGGGCPRWLPLPVGLAGLTATVCLWQAVGAVEQVQLERIVQLTGLTSRQAARELFPLPPSLVPYSTLVGGLLLAGLLTLAVLLALMAQRHARRAEQAQAGLRRSEEALRQTRDELETRVRERTAELERAAEELRQREEMLRRLNQELEQHVRELTEVNRELESFTYSVSHDLRAPLRHIDAFSKLLLEEASARLDPVSQGWLGRIREGAQQMGRMVDELLELSRMGRREPERRPTDLRALVEDALAELKPETEGREVAIQVGALPRVDCDAVLIRQVLVNLLSNALKFTRPRPRAVIEVGHTVRDGQSVIFVRDNGVGFDMQYADKLFGVFQRLHRREEFEGNGVGLATVQRIVHKHGGRIWAEAELDRGATFYFSLGQPQEARAQTAKATTAGRS